jgi:hypothetical protein
MSRIALIAPDLRRAARIAACLSPDHPDLAPYSLESFLRSRGRVRGVVIEAGDRSPARAVEFIRRVARRLLLPPPSARLGAAIAGLRDTAEEIPSQATDTGTSGLLLEGAVTPARARRALARSELSRDWIVEDPRRVRIPEEQLEELAREGVRWFALRPIELLAVVAEPGLRRRLRGAGSVIPRSTPLWDPRARKRPAP